MSKKPKYKVGQVIISTQPLETCMITDILIYENYAVKWFYVDDKANEVYHTPRLSFYVAHKYFMEIEKFDSSKL